MGSFLLLVTLLATIFTVYWSARNDRRGERGTITGLLAYLPGREPRPAERPGAARLPAIPQMIAPRD